MNILFPHHTQAKQAEELARTRVRTALGADREDDAMKEIARIYAENSEITVIEATTVYLARATQGQP